MAENHPVGFQWVSEAKLRGTKVFHVDPRYTRTSAVADRHIPIRAGSDIAFLGGIVNYILSNDRYFHDYVVNYTNAPAIIDENFADTEDLNGLFSGYDPETATYDVSSWQYEGMTAATAAGQRETAIAGGEEQGAQGAQLEGGEPPSTDKTLQHPRCVFQILKRHFSRYTPEVVEQITGAPKDLLIELAETLCANSGRERTSAFVYSVGWTHHTTGVQMIRTASIIQLLLGNIGRPGGGILALRGHASIQGSTDIPTLYNILPGYIPMPRSEHYRDGLDGYVRNNSAASGYWGNMKSYIVSLLKSYYGEAATADNQFCFDHLPRISGDHSIYPAVLGMLDGSVKGFFVLGENPAVGSANGHLHRLAMANLDWMVIKDVHEIESASFWYDGPEIDSGELRTDDIKTEVFFLPAATHTEKDGSFTNTQRLLQWHHTAVQPKEDARSDLWFIYHLGRLIKEKLANSDEPRDAAIRDLCWDYPIEERRGWAWGEPSAEAVLAEINGWDADGNALSSYNQLTADGSTACGCWIYCGAHADGINQTARRKPGDEQTWVAPEWGWAWPSNRRILYNRASADPDGNPWSERKRYVWWDAEAGRWTGYDDPDFGPTTAPSYVPDRDAQAQQALAGTAPFILQADGKGWLYVPNGLKDGPLPTHYEAHESPVANPLYRQQANPARQVFERKHNRSNPSDGRAGASAYPFVLTEYRIAEHHTAGGMSRFGRRLVELAPEFFCEVSPQLAAERGLTNGDWATIITARSAVEARVLVTGRMKPIRVGDRLVHQVGVPYHWGFKGNARGDAGNDLTSIVLDSNVHISEFKGATCDIRPGRRPRGPDLPRYVAEHRRRAGVPDDLSEGER